MTPRHDLSAWDCEQPYDGPTYRERSCPVCVPRGDMQRCSWCHGRPTFDAATGESVECGVCDHGWVVVESR